MNISKYTGEILVKRLTKCNCH